MKKDAINIKEFEKIYREYFRPLTVYALQFIDRQEIAEDIVQDLFLDLYEKGKILDNKTINKNYLYKSVQNSCINKLRYHKTRDKNESKVMQVLNSFNPTPEDIVQEIEIDHKMLEVLESLPCVNRKVFEMSRYQGKSNKEIAEIQSISKRTVESHINQALKILRKKLKKYLLIMIMVIFLCM